VIGITGSAGKTTTTALVGEMCRAAGLRTWVGGNIGNPLIADLDQIQPSDRVVMELSSFQLEVMTVSPHIAAVLNITPNHLDRHKTMEAYVAAKRNIVAHQRPEDFALLGYNEPNARSLALETAAHLLWFSAGAEVDEGAFTTNGELTLRLDGVDRAICQSAEVRLRGRHNLLNVLAASVLAGVAGVPVEAMCQVARTFTGVEHRLELVREWNGVSWYDDSIATAPERSLAALRSFEEPIVLLAGGRDKDLPWGEFAGETVQRVRQLITFGEAGPMIARIVDEKLGHYNFSEGAIPMAHHNFPEGAIPMAHHNFPEGAIPMAREQDESAAPHHPVLEEITEVETLEQAVEVAARVSRSGDVVLLSPGGTSFDAFRDFVERGERFKELVRLLGSGQRAGE
jgi:UDP-N-acetylmuramoylalanine--D-glutamate ligase